MFVSGCVIRFTAFNKYFRLFSAHGYYVAMPSAYPGYMLNLSAHPLAYDSVNYDKQEAVALVKILYGKFKPGLSFLLVAIVAELRIKQMRGDCALSFPHNLPAEVPGHFFVKVALLPGFGCVSGNNIYFIHLHTSENYYGGRGRSPPRRS